MQTNFITFLRIREALARIDVRVLDRLIVTGDAFVSFADRGLS